MALLSKGVDFTAGINSPECIAAVKDLKKTLTEAPILGYPEVPHARVRDIHRRGLQPRHLRGAGANARTAPRRQEGYCLLGEANDSSREMLAK